MDEKQGLGFDKGIDYGYRFACAKADHYGGIYVCVATNCGRAGKQITLKGKAKDENWERNSNVRGRNQNIGM